MRIITGKFKGLKLAPFKGMEIRPTADRVKESLFNILGTSVNGTAVLDLFCGSGNLGIECLSRGAKSVHFNDISKESLAVLKKNLKKIDCFDYKITNLSYQSCLNLGVIYDIIFIDPPYASDYGIKALEIIAKNNLLSPQGIAVLESEKIMDDAGLEKYDERKYGRTVLSFFRMK